MDNEEIAEIFKADCRAITKCVTIRADQDRFIKEEKKFMLSRFLQIKLDEWIKFREGCKEIKGGDYDEKDEKVE